MEEQRQTDVAVLREMVRLAELRRSEELEWIERVNKYNLAIIAFDGSFLSVLVSMPFEKLVIASAGGCLMISITLSLFTLFPRRTFGGALLIEDDVDAIRNGTIITIEKHLLDTADLTERAANILNRVSHMKLRLTMASVSSLALGLFAAYTIHTFYA